MLALLEVSGGNVKEKVLMLFVYTKEYVSRWGFGRSGSALVCPSLLIPTVRLQCWAVMGGEGTIMRILLFLAGHVQDYGRILA